MSTAAQPDAGETIWVMFEQEGGDSTTIEFRRDDTIGAVREALRNQFGEDKGIMMSFKTSALTDDTKKLSELGIGNLSRISLGSRLRSKQSVTVHEVSSDVPFLRQQVDYFTVQPRVTNP
jgi:hypothetical protein